MTIAELAGNPPESSRPVPFWSWNDKLEAEELSRQIRLMHEAGLGGFFMHARGGLLTDYLGEEWFSLTKTAIRTAAECSMNPWAYDENGWPSGFGNGRVNGLGERFQQKYLRWKKIVPAELPGAERVIAFYSADGRRLSREEAEKQTEILLFYYEVNPYYVDTLDRDVTETFLETVHQAYCDALTEEERKVMKGFFTDEPQISRNGIPWSFLYEKEYRAAYGEELLDVLPRLFLPLDGRERTRWRFWRLTTRLFLNNFMKPIYDWCSAHGWMLTGHQVCEDHYGSQLTCNGAVMPHYQYYHIPGMDALGRHTVSLATTLQLASAAAQTGKKQILSETFALCGWAVDFADLKWLYQWQTVHGINLLCQHLEGYSLRGIRKRDYPASLFIHQPWWKGIRPFNDAFSRIGVLLSEGEIRTEVLLLHGITTAHILYDTTEKAQEHLMQYSDHFESLSRLLEGAHLNHHYGDETLMEQYGSVAEGILNVGHQSYRLVLLPKLMNLSSGQAELLTEFLHQGGTVLGVRNDLDPHFYIDGEAADSHPLLREILWFPTGEEMVQEAMRRSEPLPAVLKGTAPEAVRDLSRQQTAVHVTRRFYHDFDGRSARLCYYVNTNRFDACEADLYPGGNGVEMFDPETGKLRPVFFEKTAAGIRVPHRFEPAGALLLLVREEETPSAPEQSAPPRLLRLRNEFRIADCTENLLVLDFCGYEVDGEKISDREYVLSIQDALLKRERDADVVLTFRFTAGPTCRIGEAMELLLEHPERYAIELNGTRISNKPEGFFADKAFERIAIGHAVVAGENILRLRTHFHQKPETYAGIAAARRFESEKNKLSFDSEIEAVYLCGAFGVSVGGEIRELDRNALRCGEPFSLEALPERTDIRRIERSGFPFFAGSMTLTQNFDLPEGEPPVRSRIEFRKLFAHIAEIRVNGEAMGTLTRPDYVLEIPETVLHAGENTLQITLTNSLRNMLGPFHKEEGESFGVGPGSFYKDPGVFCPNGAADWNGDYCILRFGAEMGEAPV